MVYIHFESKKGCHPNHDYYSVNSWSFCKILSLLQRALNFQQNPYKVTHHTLSMLLHYLGKLINQKFCTFHARKTCFECDSLSSIQRISVKYHKRRCIKCPPFAQTHAWRQYSLSNNTVHWLTMLVKPLGCCSVRHSWTHLQPPNSPHLNPVNYMVWGGEWWSSMSTRAERTLLMNWRNA